MATKNRKNEYYLSDEEKERLAILFSFLYDNPKIAKSFYDKMLPDIDKMLPDITKWEEEWIDDPRYTV